MKADVARRRRCDASTGGLIGETWAVVKGVSPQRLACTFTHPKSLHVELLREKCVFSLLSCFWGGALLLITAAAGLRGATGGSGL